MIRIRNLIKNANNNIFMYSKATIWKTKSMGLEFLLGIMATSGLAIGERGTGMEKECW